MNASAVLVAACDELLGSGKTAAQIAREIGDVDMSHSPDGRSLRAIYTRGVEGQQPNEAAVAAVLDALVGKASSGGTLSKNPATGVYVVS